MASLYNVPGKGWRIQFVDWRGRRRSVMVGRATKRQAESVCRHVEELIGAKQLGVLPAESTALWLTRVGKRLREALRRAELVEGGATIGEMIDRYTEMKAKTVKSKTMCRLELSMGHLRDGLGVDRLMSDVTEAEAVELRAEMVNSGLAEATIRKRCADMRALWSFAMKDRTATENPFLGVPVTTVARADHVYIDHEASMAVLDELPSAKWRALWAFARWGGVRVPSEPRELMIDDIVWRHGEDGPTPGIVVTDSKRTVGKNVERRTRRIPMFDGPMEGALLAAIDELPDGERRVFPWLAGASGDSVRKPLVKAIKRAGLVVWPDLWRNVRSSRERELHDAWAADVAQTWMGNSEAVAHKHYLRVTDELMRAAAGGGLHTAVHTSNPK